jgi:hypothetical protein
MSPIQTSIQTPAPISSAPPAPPLTSARRPIDRRLGGFLGWAVVVLSGGYSFLDYWNYSRMWHGDPREWADLLAGQGIAPAQYRIGVLKLAAWLGHLSHMELRHAFAFIDFVCVAVSLVSILVLLARSSLFRTGERLQQWALSLLCLGLFTGYLYWTFWFQKPETIPTLAFLALSALLAASERTPKWLVAAALLLLALLQATVRADVAVAFHLGMLLAAMLPGPSNTPRSIGLPLRLGRAGQAIISGMAIVGAGAVQYGIVHGLYPHAQRNADAIQIVSNLQSSMGYLAIVLSLTGWWVTLWLAGRRWRRLDAWTRGLLLGSVAHFAMFYAMGMAEEVRIFLPFAMVVLPITAALFCEAFMLGEVRQEKAA